MAQVLCHGEGDTRRKASRHVRKHVHIYGVGSMARLLPLLLCHVLLCGHVGRSGQRSLQSQDIVQLYPRHRADHSRESTLFHVPELQRRTFQRTDLVKYAAILGIYKLLCPNHTFFLPRAISNTWIGALCKKD